MLFLMIIKIMNFIFMFEVIMREKILCMLSINFVINEYYQYKYDEWIIDNCFKLIK